MEYLWLSYKNSLILSHLSVVDIQSQRPNQWSDPYYLLKFVKHTSYLQFAISAGKGWSLLQHTEIQSRIFRYARRKQIEFILENTTRKISCVGKSIYKSLKTRECVIIREASLLPHPLQFYHVIIWIMYTLYAYMLHFMWRHLDPSFVYSMYMFVLHRLMSGRRRGGNFVAAGCTQIVISASGYLGNNHFSISLNDV